MKKSLLVTLGLAFIVVLSFAFTDAKPRYKNLKVLPKHTTKEQMDTIMKHFSVSLGVKCNFCHVFNQEQKSMDFASDANEHKDVARQMMSMTKKINKKFFEFTSFDGLKNTLQVTCYTCHGGKEEPSSWPSLTEKKQ